MIDLNVQNETNQLLEVVLGTAHSSGPVPSLEEAYDPKSKYFISIGEYPEENDMVAELDQFEEVLKKHGVTVRRPQVLTDVNQIFARDIAFVIGSKIVVSNPIEQRKKEIEGITYILEQIEPSRILHLPDEVHIEGGDVMPWNGELFVGYSKEEDFDKYKVSRTNEAGIEFLKDHFPEWNIHAFELKKSDDDPHANALHLDCCFQPIGTDHAIIFPGGFKNQEDAYYLRSYFGENKIIEISSDEMYNMFSNVFSIAPDVIVSESRFIRLNKELRNRNFTVEEVPFYEISKQEGLLRCATMPLRRK